MKIVGAAKLPPGEEGRQKPKHKKAEKVNRARWKVFPKPLTNRAIFIYILLRTITVSDYTATGQTCRKARKYVCITAVGMFEPLVVKRTKKYEIFPANSQVLLTAFFAGGMGDFTKGKRLFAGFRKISSEVQKSSCTLRRSTVYNASVKKSRIQVDADRRPLR